MALAWSLLISAQVLFLLASASHAQTTGLSITSTHTGNFTQGDPADTYTITVSNPGTTASTGAVNVTDLLPGGMTATQISGTGWTVNLGALTATRSDSLAAGASYPPITVTVNVASNAQAALTNTASVVNNGELITAYDTTIVNPIGPGLTITCAHTGNFIQGDAADTYTLTVSNLTSVANTGTVKVSDVLPSGMTATQISGTGWTVNLGSLTATRSDSLAAGASYPPITVTVSVASNAQANLTNTASVVANGQSMMAYDPTVVTSLGPDLTVTSVHTGNFNQRDTADVYTLTVTNSGSTATTGTVALADTLPAGLTVVTMKGTGWTIPSGSLTATRTDALAPGASYPQITLTVSVAATAPSTVTNTVVVSGGGETNTSNDTVYDNTIVNPVGPDLTVVTSHTGNFQQGDLRDTCTVTVTNSGNASTTGPVSLVDALPAGLTPISIGGTGWTSSNNTTVTRSDALAPGASYPPITVTFAVAANASTSVINTVNVSGGGETNTANDTGYDLMSIIAAAPDLNIVSSHLGNFTQGDVADTYTLTVSNIGTTTTVGAVNIADVLPAGLTATGLGGPGWTVNLAALTATRSDPLPAGGTYPSLTLTVNVASTALSVVTNTATVSGGGEQNTGNDTYYDYTSVNPLLPDLAVSCTHSANFTQNDAADTYTIIVTNVGNAPTTGVVTLTEKPPLGLGVANISGSGWTLTPGTFTLTRSDALAGGASYPPITVTVSVAATAAPTVTNVATVSGGGEKALGNDSAYDLTTINQLVPDLTIVSSHVGSFTQGDTADTYTLTVTNSGNAPTTNLVSVADVLPTGLTATAFKGTGWTTNQTSLTATRSDALAAGASYPPLILTVQVASTTAPSVTNEALVSGGGETNTGNNTYYDSTLVNAVAPDMTVTSTHSGSFRQGDATDTYIITATNSGTAPTNGQVTLVDTLPTGLTTGTANGSGWTTLTTGTTLIATRSDVLAAGASYPPITLNVAVSSTAPSSVSNSVAVAGGGEQNTGNDTAFDPTTIIQVSSNLKVTSSHTGNFPQGDAADTYTLTVTNAGTVATSGTVSLADVLPTGLTATSMSGTGWAINQNTLTATRSDSLGAGLSYPPITLIVSVATTAAPNVTNTVTVTNASQQSTAYDSTNIVALAPDLVIALSPTANFKQGDTADTYTITVSNNGNASTTGTVIVADVLPAGLTLVSLAGNGWTVPTGSATASRSDALAAGASYPPLVLTVSVLSTAPASVTNTATVSGGGELNTGNDTASNITAIAPTASDMTIAMVQNGVLRQGDTGDTYTLTVTNAGNVATSGTVTVTDTLPTGLTASHFSGSGWTILSSTGSSVAATCSTALAAGASYPPLTVTLNVASNASATVINIATVTGGGEQNTTNDSAVLQSPVTAMSPDLTISVTNVVNFKQGDTGDYYVILVSNVGNLASSGTVTVGDALPPGMTATSIAGSGWTGNLSTLTATRSDALSPGASYPPLTITVNVASTAATPSTDTATVSGGGDTNLSNNTGYDVAPITAVAPDLTVTNTYNGSFNQGDTGDTYTITVTNSGNAATSGAVNLVDVLPAGLTASNLAGNGWTITSNLTATRSDALAAGASYPALTLTVNVSATAAATLTNAATASGGGETNTGNDSAYAITPIAPVAPDLVLSCTHAGKFKQGDTTGDSYTITVSNYGNAPTSGTVSLADILPAGLTLNTASGQGWTVNSQTLTATRSDALSYIYNSANAAYSYPPLTVNVIVSATAPSSVLNTAMVSGGGEQNTNNDTAYDNTAITPVGPDLTVSVVHGNTPFLQGGTGTYTATVFNAGTTATTAPSVLSIALPTGLSGATIVGPSGWTTSSNGTNLTATTSAALASLTSATFTITANVAANAPANLTTVATVSGGGELNTNNDTATDVVYVQPENPDLTVSCTHSNAANTSTTFKQGETGDVYTIIVTNIGSAATSGVVSVADALPAGFTVTGWTGNNWTVNRSTLTATRSDALASGATYDPLYLTVSVSTTAPASVNNTVTVSGGGEQNTANDSFFDVTAIIPQGPVLGITKTHTATFMQGDLSDAYTIVVTNNGSASTSGTVTVIDTLPVGLTPVSMTSTDSGWTINQTTLTATRSDVLASGSSYGALVVTVSVAINAPTAVTNVATVSGGGAQGAAVNAYDVTSITPTLSISMNHTGSYTQGSTGVPFIITVKNTGASPISGAISVADTLPTGLTVAGFSGTGWTCNSTTLIATRSDSLAAGASYPALTLTVNIASDAASGLTNTATLTSATSLYSATAYDFLIMSPSSLTVSAPVTATVNTAISFTVTAISNSITESAYNGTMHFTSTDTSATLPADTALVNGTGTFSVTFKTTGSQTITATDTSSSSITGTSGLIVVGTTSSVAQAPQAASALTAPVSPQTGTFLMPVQVTNTTGVAINGFRLHVSALSSTVALSNATSPAGSSDLYVDYPYPVAAGQVATVTLQYSSPGATTPSMTPTYSAEILYAPTVATTDYYPIQLQGINQQTDGSFLLQFPSVPGHWYRIKYSTDLINWYNAQVPVLATDVSTSWADGGPPSTDTHPAATTARFYKANDITP